MSPAQIARRPARRSAGRPARQPATAAPTVLLLGNTTVQAYPTDGRRLLPAQRLTLPTVDFLAASLARPPRAWRRLLSGPLAVCSVHAAALRHLQVFARAAGLPLNLYTRDFGPSLPLHLDAAGRKTVGPDRLAASLAAHAECPAGALVCDCGTALTVNRVSARGFEGGLIAPGFELALQALHQGTSRLPRLTAAPPRTFPARNTPAAMRLGCLLALVALIEKIHAAEDRVFRRNSPTRGPLPLILTGGAGIMVRRRLACAVRWRPHLTAAGVWLSFNLPPIAGA
ncbi:MAG: type III pantothenate kinase [Planctomycetota bacterium]